MMFSSSTGVDQLVDQLLAGNDPQGDVPITDASRPAPRIAVYAQNTSPLEDKGRMGVCTESDFHRAPVLKCTQTASTR